MLVALALQAGVGATCGGAHNTSALVHLNNTGHWRVEAADLWGCCAQCAPPRCGGWAFDGGSPPCKLSPRAPFRVDRSANPALGGGVPVPPPPAPAGRPNIVFLVVESTDGRTWQPGYQNGALALPNLRALQSRGAEFRLHYANAPVCCPSRASFMSGRHVHNIPHAHQGLGPVGGDWNNYEGLPSNYSDRIDQVLERAGYQVGTFGKTDWSTGGHGESSSHTDLALWTMYANLPYNITEDGGWIDEVTGGGCSSNGTVQHGGSAGAAGSAHAGDWSTLNAGVKWLAEAAAEYNASGRPFYAYQGMNIVHPPYATSQFWYDLIDPQKVDVPPWPAATAAALEAQHPCDLQSSMLKGCIPALGDAASVALLYSDERRRRIRRIYLAMVAEFDAMVGAWMNAVRAAGVWDSTVWIVTSDHGDMQMEHQQHYKMVPREASSSVPMVIFDGRPGKSLPAPRVVMEPSQLIDIFPTIMDYAEVPQAGRPTDLDGASLLPFMASEVEHAGSAGAGRPGFVTSQFHGCNIAMSWFLVVQNINNHTYKLIQWGTGKEVVPQLFDLTADPQEYDNLLNTSTPSDDVKHLLTTLDASLQTAIPYPSIAQQVAQYNKDSFGAWVNVTKDWQTAIHKSGLRWDDSWNDDPAGAIAAVNDWMAQPAVVQACRSELVWPPKAGENKNAPLL